MLGDERDDGYQRMLARRDVLMARFAALAGPIEAGGRGPTRGEYRELVRIRLGLLAVLDQVESYRADCRAARRRDEPTFEPADGPVVLKTMDDVERHRRDREAELKRVGRLPR